MLRQKDNEGPRELQDLQRAVQEPRQKGAGIGQTWALTTSRSKGRETDPQEHLYSGRGDGAKAVKATG